MSVNGVFRTSVSGMNAQASRLSVVSENIANASTDGYKRGTTEFATLVLANSGNEYNSGSVSTQVRHLVSQQGSISASSSASDLAIQGDGFFIVQDTSGRDFYTRAGSFVQRTDPDTNTTFLVNTAGYRLTGTNLETGATETVQLPVGKLIAPQASTSATMELQLPSQAVVGDPTSTKTRSIVVYDKLGAERTIDITFTKTADDTWSVTAADRDGTSTGPGALPDITFDPSTGLATAGDGGFSVTYPDGTAVAVSFPTLTQYASDFNAKTSADGNPAGAISEFSFTSDGRVVGVMASGKQIPLYQLNVARFQSPDQLHSESGNVYSATENSGDVEIGSPGKNGFGEILSGATEQSNVDLATELTDMIESQRSYSANSKVFQTGSEILDVIIGLKR